jgi:hypothetical protein
MSIALVALVLLAVGVATRFWRPNSVPGPKSLPLIGNWRDTRGKPLYLVLTRWSRQFGDFFSYRVGSDPVFVVAGISAFDELFNKKGTLYNSRPSGSELARRVTAGSRGVALPYGEPWKVGTLFAGNMQGERLLTRIYYRSKGGGSFRIS